MPRTPRPPTFGGTLTRRARARASLVAAVGVATSLVAGLMVAPLAEASPLKSARAGLVSGPHSLVATTGAAAGTAVQLTPQTIVVPPATVKSDLVSQSGDTFTFSSAAGPLAATAPGKVLLLEGRDAVVVTHVQHSGSKLIVTTTPANMSDVVKSGQIEVNSTPSASAGISVPGSENSGSRSVSTAGVFGDSGALRSGPVVLNGVVAGSGKFGKWSWSLKLTPQGSGLGATANICYTASGPSCGGSGTSVDVTLTGTFSWGSQSLDLGVAGGALSKGSFSISGMSSDMNLNYAVIRGGDDTPNAGPPVFKIPFSFAIPLCGTPLGCAGLPLMAKFSTALFVKIALSSKNSSVEGGVHVTIGGNATVGGFSLGGVSGSVTSPVVKGTFNTGSHMTPGAAGIVVALQAKFGVGLGISSVSGLYYISAIASVGETTGSAVAGESCIALNGSFSITGNFEVQLWKFKKTSPAKTFYNKPASYKQPPC